MMHALAEIIALFCFATAGLLVARLVAIRIRQADLQRLDTILAISAATPRIAGVPTHLPPFLVNKLARAGWEPDRRQIGVGAAAFLVTVIVALIASGILAAILIVVSLLFLGLAALDYRANARIRQLSDCMLGLLERMRQLLSVGNSLAVALDRAVENSPPIVGQCLAPTLRRIANGSGVADSLERCAAELDVYELHLLATASRTNLRFGGSMTAILRNIIENIRKRGSVERELRANTTQIRASAWVLALLPI